MWNWTENQIELYLIRHGMTLGNVEHRYIGRQTDEPLSEDGRQQLEKRKDQWAQVCRTWDMPYVFVSPMLRCRQTAEILFPQIPQIEIDPWREMDFGEFEGKNYAQLKNSGNVILVYLKIRIIKNCRIARNIRHGLTVVERWHFREVRAGRLLSQDVWMGWSWLWNRSGSSWHTERVQSAGKRKTTV